MRLLAQFVNGPLVDHLEIQQQPAHHGALPCINMPNHYKAGALLSLVFFELGDDVEVAALRQWCLGLGLVSPSIVVAGRRSGLLGLGPWGRLLSGCGGYQ